MRRVLGLVGSVAVIGLAACGADPSGVVEAGNTTVPPATSTTTTIQHNPEPEVMWIDEVDWHALRVATTTTVRVTRSRPQVTGDVWRALAQCESGMRQDAVGEGVHYSYFQWKLATWRSVKAEGDPDDPRNAEYGVQVAAAKRLQARSGWGQWPACSRRLGLR